MTDGQKIHRLIGVMYNGSKKTALYKDLLEDFNDGLWLDKINHEGLVKICDVLVNDELATFVTGTHTYTENSDKASSTGIAINTNAYTAYINKKYIAGDAPPIASRAPIILAIAVAVIAVGYIFYQSSMHSERMDTMQLELQRMADENSKVIAKKDSAVSALQIRVQKLEAMVKDAQIVAEKYRQELEKKKKPVKKR